MNAKGSNQLKTTCYSTSRCIGHFFLLFLMVMVILVSTVTVIEAMWTRVVLPENKHGNVIFNRTKKVNRAQSLKCLLKQNAKDGIFNCVNSRTTTVCSKGKKNSTIKWKSWQLSLLHIHAVIFSTYSAAPIKCCRSITPTLSMLHADYIA